MKKKALLLVMIATVIGALNSAPAQASRKIENNTQRRVNEKLYRSLLKDGIKRGFPGFILGVKVSNKKAWIGAEGESNIEKSIRMKPNARFHIASITKIFTATAILKLVDEGRLSLDTKVTDLLNRQLLSPIPYIDEITVSQLLDHSSGIYGFNNDQEYIQTLIGSRVKENVRWTPEKFVALAYGNRVKPFGKPGTGNYYGDTNYVLLGMIVEKVSGMSIRQFVSKNIFVPLEMKNTGYYGETENPEIFEIPVTTQGYLQLSKIVDSIVTLDSSFKLARGKLVNTTKAGEKIDATARIVSTAGDLIKFGSALYGGKVISEKSLKWLMSAEKKLEKEKIGESVQSVTTIYKKPYGNLFNSAGDGPGGTNAILAYHPDSKTVLVGFTNIFAMFDEKDFMRDKVFDKIILSN